jgi:hypothetical protein
MRGEGNLMSKNMASRFEEERKREREKERKREREKERKGLV